MLVRGDFVVLRFDWDVHFTQLFVHNCHKVQHFGGDTAKVVVLHLLGLRWSCSKQSPTTLLKIDSFVEQDTVHQKVFLFDPSHRLYRVALHSKLGEQLSALL